MPKKKSKKQSPTKKPPALNTLNEPKFVEEEAGILSLLQIEKLPLGILFFIYLLYVLWGFLSPYTWDDDCAARFQHTIQAAHKPKYFVSLWDRPLWIWLFYFPAKLGTFVVPVFMSFFSVLAGWCTYKSAQKLNLKYPILAAIFLLMQPFFMGVGRDVMTEPLATLIIAVGLYFHLNKKYLSFALIGSLLPLARLELSVLLVLWAFILLVNKQWKYISLLAIGLLLWSFAAYLIHGDFFYILNQTIFKEVSENRYGHQVFNTYLSRYFYVIGPVVFFFLISGIIKLVVNKRFDLLVLIQYIGGFSLYTLFAWKINLGNSAGFLRNLIPMSSLAAIIALYGLNSILDKEKRMKILASLGILTSIALTACFFRNKLRSHHKISEEFDPYNLTIVIGLGLISLAYIWLSQHQKIKYILKNILVFGSIIIISGHTLITEPPDKNKNSKRDIINTAAKMIMASDRSDKPVYCNHTFYYWAAGINQERGPSLDFKIENLEKAPYGSIVIWESHFGNRFGSDIELKYLFDRPNEYLEISRMLDDKNSFHLYIFEKIAPRVDKLKKLASFIRSTPYFSAPVVRRAVYYREQNRMEDALEELNFATSIDPKNAFAFYEKSNVYTKLRKYDLALQELNKALAVNENFLNAMLLKANIYYTLNNLKEAEKFVDMCIVKNKNYKEAYFIRGNINLKYNKKGKACQDFNQAASLGYNKAAKLIQEYCK